MPFGQKPDPTGGPNIDFDKIYHSAIQPAIIESGLEPIRADQEEGIGIIHKAMFERLLLCEFAIADLTTANANVFYELGVRHTGKASTTLAIYANTQPIPFDLNFLRGLPYDIGKENRFGEEQAAALKAQLIDKLLVLQKNYRAEQLPDSPVFQLIDEWTPSEISHLNTDVFRKRARLNEDRRATLASARSMPRETGVQKLKELQQLFQEEGWIDIGSAVDLFLSYRGFMAWNEMIALYDRFPKPFKHQVKLREQYALALNRRASTEDATETDRPTAIDILNNILKQQGDNPETLGLLGRVYKDLWSEIKEQGGRKARAALSNAIATYLRGFESDWRDFYPGINALTLMNLSEEEEHLQQRQKIGPIVRYAVERSIAQKTPDYWDRATLLELAVLDNDENAIDRALDELLKIQDVELRQYETTANNIQMIHEAMCKRGEQSDLVEEVIYELRQAVS